MTASAPASIAVAAPTTAIPPAPGTWEVSDHADGSQTSVTWELHPAALWRRVLLVRIRARRLARNGVPASLFALGRAVLDVQPAGG